MSPEQLQHYLPYLIAPLIALVIILRRSGRAQKVRLNSMWIRPLIFLGITGAALAVAPMPGLIAVAAFVAAAAAGAGVGYLRGRHVEFSIDDAGAITSKATQLGTILIIAVLAVRFGLRFAFPELAANPGSHLNKDAMAWSDGSLIFLCGMILAQVITVYVRTRPLVAAHAARIAGQAPQS